MKSFGFNFHTIIEKLQSNGKILVLSFFAVLILMAASCIIVFFAVVKDKEQVMVPNVTGESLENALLEMQVKELYPKIQLRYSNDPAEKGTILSQDPEQGAIVKAGRRINLVVSRGVIIDQVENYIGMSLDEVKVKLQTLFAGSSVPLIVLADPVYEYDDENAAGIILQQEPPEGTSISEPVAVKFVISRGPEYEKTKIPNLIGLSVNDTLLQMSRSKLIFSFTVRFPEETEVIAPGSDTSENKIAKVVSQKQKGGEETSIYSRISAEFIMPAESVDGISYGIFETELPWYPYALPIELDALTQEGERYAIVTINHTGGPLTIPYAVPQNTILILSVSGQEQMRQTVN